MLNYYASAINIPSKQLTTGQVSNIGVPYKYATGQAFSQINILHLLSLVIIRTQTLFERWVQETFQEMVINMLITMRIIL